MKWTIIFWVLALCLILAQYSLAAISPRGFQVTDAEVSALRSFEKIAENLDISHSSVTLKSSSGGTSVYVVVHSKNKDVGAVMPQNGAGKIFGEIAGYTLSEALGFSSTAQKAVYFPLKGKQREAFHKHLTSLDRNKMGKWKKKNYDTIKNNLEAARKKGADTPLPAVFMLWDQGKPRDYSNIHKKNRLNLDDPIAKFLSATSPKPSNTLVSLPGIKGRKASQKDLAIQMSNIFLVDAIIAQWDRFSGGNFQYIRVEPNSFRFVAFDSGGAFEKSWRKRYYSWVSRFHRPTAEGILRLDDFIQGKATQFQGFTSTQDLQKALGLAHPGAPWKLIKEGIGLTADHIRKTVSAHGEASYF